MELDFKELDPEIRYKILTSTVIPRPIALVTTRSRDGIDNAAPFSFFNVFGEDPPLLVLGLQSKDIATPKDTTRNIRETNEFVVQLVDEKLAKAMNDCAVDFPENISEFDLINISRAKCKRINVSRIAEAPVAFECRRTLILQLNETRDLAIGEIIYMHVRDGIINPKNMRLDLSEYKIIGRLFSNLYTNIEETFTLDRINHKEWLEKIKS